MTVLSNGYSIPRSVGQGPIDASPPGTHADLLRRAIDGTHSRRTMTTAVEEWVGRYPEFELVDPSLVTWSAGQVRGPREVPVRILTQAG